MVHNVVLSMNLADMKHTFGASFEATSREMRLRKLKAPRKADQRQEVVSGESCAGSLQALMATTICIVHLWKYSWSSPDGNASIGAC